MKQFQGCSYQKGSRVCLKDGELEEAVESSAALTQDEKSVKETFISEDGQKITVVSVKKRKNLPLTPQQRAQLIAQQQGRATKKRKLNKIAKPTKGTKGKKRAQKVQLSSSILPTGMPANQQHPIMNNSAIPPIQHQIFWVFQCNRLFTTHH